MLRIYEISIAVFTHTKKMKLNSLKLFRLEFKDDNNNNNALKQFIAVDSIYIALFVCELLL